MKRKLLFTLVFVMTLVLLIEAPLTVLATTGEGAPTPRVTITSLTESGGTVTVRGTSENLGDLKVEVIVNGDLSLRFVAESDEIGAWSCTFPLSYNGEYTVEASIRDYSDFNKIRQTTPDESYFLLEDSNVWGATVTRHTDGLYYMLFSTWDTHQGFSSDWYYHSEIGYAVSTELGGPYVYMGSALDKTYSNTTNEAPVKWQYGTDTATIDVFHNPTVMHSEKDGKYYLYFMGTSTDNTDKTHGRQRVGVAYADSPAGPWTVMDTPVIDVREDSWDYKFTANPSVMEIRNEDGSYTYYALYKGSGKYEGQSLTATGVGTATSPLGPFTRADAPIMRDPEIGFSVEDCYVWQSEGKYYALAKDMTRGNWTGVTGAYSYALFESADGENWALSENKLAFKNEILWERGTQQVSHLERSQLYLEKGIPFMLLNATTINGKSPYNNHQPYNVQTPLLGVALATDEKTLTVTDLTARSVDKSVLLTLAEQAATASKGCFERKAWLALKTAQRAAKVLLERERAEQSDVDFVVAQLQNLLAEKKDPTQVTQNVVLNKPITASNIYSDEYPAALAVDGIVTTRWASENSVGGNVTLEFDLQKDCRIESFYIAQYHSRITAYKWEYLEDGVWKTCFESERGIMYGVFAEGITTKKLRLIMTEYTAAPSIYEIEVLGSPLDGNVAYGKPATPSNIYSDGYTADLALDGNAKTRWATQNDVSGTVTLEIDLQGLYALKGFSMSQYSDRIIGYKWEYFQNDTWTTCFEGQNGVMLGDFTGDVHARWLRLHILEYTAAPSIWEIEVYGQFIRDDSSENRPPSEEDLSASYPPPITNPTHDTHFTLIIALGASAILLIGGTVLTLYLIKRKKNSK